MPRKVVKYDGMRVRLRKGQTSLSTAQKNAIHAMESDRSGRATSKSDACTIVFFGRKAVQRCTDRKLKTGAKARYKRLVRSKRLCRRGKGKRKLFSNRC